MKFEYAGGKIAMRPAWARLVATYSNDLTRAVRLFAEAAIEQGMSEGLACEVAVSSLVREIGIIIVSAEASLGIADPVERNKHIIDTLDVTIALARAVVKRAMS